MNDPNNLPAREQTEESIRAMAEMASGYYNQLVKDGIRPEHACRITCTFVEAIVMRDSGANEG